MKSPEEGAFNWRQGTSELTPHTPKTLEPVAHKLNTRPRKTLDWDTPAQRLAELLAAG